MSEGLDNSGGSGIIESKQKEAILQAFENGKTSDEIVMTVIKNHTALSAFTPESMKRSLEKMGYNVKPLGGKSSLKDIPFEYGGGYRVTFLGDGYFQYHPKKNSHHGDAYCKVTNGKNKRRYNLDGTEKTD